MFNTPRDIMAGGIMIIFIVADCVPGSSSWRGSLDVTQIPPVRFTTHKRVLVVYPTLTHARTGNKHFYTMP